MNSLTDSVNLAPSKSTYVLVNLIDYLLKNIRHGTIDVHWPNGNIETYTGKENLHLKSVLIVHDWALLKQVVSSGAIGFGEGYLNNRWSSPDIAISVNRFHAMCLCYARARRSTYAREKQHV